MKNVILVVFLSLVVFINTYSQSSKPVVTNSIDKEKFEKTLLKLKELSKYKWGVVNKLWPGDTKVTIDENSGGFKFLSNNVIEFNIGCGSQADIIQCKFIDKNIKNTGIKLEIPNPDIYLTSLQKDDIFNQLGCFKIINDKKIIGEYIFRYPNGARQVYCGGTLGIFTLVRLN